MQEAFFKPKKIFLTTFLSELQLKSKIANAINIYNDNNTIFLIF